MPCGTREKSPPVAATAALTAAQTLAAAYDNDPKTALGQTCEANFYGGKFALLKKNKPEALQQLRLAAHYCPRSFIESTAAIAELIAAALIAAAQIDTASGCRTTSQRLSSDS